MKASSQIGKVLALAWWIGQGGCGALLVRGALTGVVLPVLNSRSSCESSRSSCCIQSQTLKWLPPSRIAAQRSELLGLSGSIRQRRFDGCCTWIDGSIGHVILFFVIC
jgi:hypothetical protein